MIAQHILVPLDFSEPSNQALDYALELASKLGARLTLVHVFQTPSVGTPALEPSLATYFQQLELEATQTMDDHAQRGRAAGLAADGIIMHGVPFQQIINLARARHVDLIVMGTHGRTGLQHFVLGSVAEKVVRLAPCPVLVTRPPAATPAP
jgi:nucleotide-binding universal stress UspA family protein